MKLKLRMKSPAQKAEEAFREQRMAEIVAFYDQWTVAEIRADGEVAFIPHPLWDNEWLLSRSHFSTREAALAEVARVGGVLIDDGEGSGS